MSRAKQRLRDKGIEANEVSASRTMLVPHTALKVAPKGHPLFDIRSLDPVSDAIARDMVARVEAGKCPNSDPLLVWEVGSDLWIGDGHQREKALRRASELLGGRVLMVQVEFFQGDEQEFLLERARRNHDPFARVDSITVLAFRVKQLVSAGVETARIVAAMPREVGPAEVDALSRHDSLVRELRARFDAGEFAIGLLGAVLDVPRDEQVARAEKLKADGIRSTRAATRRTNAERAERDPWARPMGRRALVKVADALDGDAVASRATSRTKAFHEGLREGLAQGLRIASGRDVEAVFELLPEDLVQAIRAARAGK